MGQTVREIAIQLGITKPAVQHRMNRIEGFRDDYATKIGNRLVINELGVKALSDIDEKTRHRQSNEKRQSEPIGKDALLSEQLKVKDEQLEIAQQQIGKMQELLDQQQQLQIESTKVHKELNLRIKNLEKHVDIDAFKHGERKNPHKVDKQINYTNAEGQADNRNSETIEKGSKSSSSKSAESRGFFRRFIKD